MKLLDVQTGKWLEAEIDRISEQDIQEIEKSNRFRFDWKKELIHEVYKVYLTKDGFVVGLVALKDIPQDIRVHVQLIESSRNNTGKRKRLDRIPGCLIAYACELSFKKGYDGFVSLTPKTQLVNHYIKKYGFI